MRMLATALATLGALVAISGAAANAATSFELSVVMTGAGALKPSHGLSLHCKSSCYGRRHLTVPSRVTLFAEPAPGWKLLIWYGPCAGSGPTCSLQLTANASVSVVFAPEVTTGLRTKIPTITMFPIYADGDLRAWPDGSVWFTASTQDGGGQQLTRMTPSGAITQFPLPDGHVTDFTHGPDGNLWFTASQAHKIGRLTPSGAIQEFVIRGGKTGPVGITAGPDGNLWFTERSTEFPSPSRGGPRAPDRTVYKIGRITQRGTITEFNLPRAGVSARAITAGPDGNIWFTEPHAVGRVTPTGAITEFRLPGNDTPGEITAGPDGNLWFTLLYEGNAQTRDAVNRSRNWIVRMSRTGHKSYFPVPNGPRGVWLSAPHGITAAQDGNLWLTSAETIERITPSGTITRFNRPASSSAITAGTDHNLWLRLSFGRAIGEIALPR
jgi:virginiamycin B lyase